MEVDHHTDDLPELPQRDRTIPADRWVEAPPELRALGADIGHPVVIYKRRIGGWLLWRAGPAQQGRHPLHGAGRHRPRAGSSPSGSSPTAPARGRAPTASSTPGSGPGRRRCGTRRGVTEAPPSLGYPPGMDAEHARQLIGSERERLEGLVREREARGSAPSRRPSSISELSSHDQHQGDLGTETFEREKDFSLLEQLEAEIGDLDPALRKVEEGTYGICEVCSREIDPERLEAMPGTRTCIEHAGARLSAFDHRVPSVAPPRNGSSRSRRPGRSPTPPPPTTPTPATPAANWRRRCSPSSRCGTS